MWPQLYSMKNRQILRGLLNLNENIWRTVVWNKLRRELSYTSPLRQTIILGVETSCDDTGIAIVDDSGAVLGEAIHSQIATHVSFGGIIPPVAREYHRRNITDVCEKAMRNAGVRLRDIDAIATTVKPGMALSLMIGKNFGKYLSKLGNKPFIPIHHMEAHALTARMKENVNFPFLVLLISGGHCLLALVQSVTEFHVLGTTIDDAPGEAFDKTARRLKLSNIREYRNKSGGAAIELAASKATNIKQFEFPSFMSRHRDCNFSFAGMKHSANRLIEQHEMASAVMADAVMPDIENFCAAFQLAVAKQIAHKTKRAMEFLDMKNLIPEEHRTLVVSGGVACNNFIAKVLDIICNETGYRFVRTPPQLCMDNGIMIAWNGIERWKIDAGVLRNPGEIEKVDFQARAPLGDDWTDRVRDMNIKCKSIKTKHIFPEMSEMIN